MFALSALVNIFAIGLATVDLKSLGSGSTPTVADPIPVVEPRSRIIGARDGGYGQDGGGKGGDRYGGGKGDWDAGKPSSQGKPGPPQFQVVTKCTVKDTVALTFDDGPYLYTKDIVTTLSNSNAKGTFFFNGKNFGGCIYDQDRADAVKYAFEKGHQIASHTWSHANLAQLGWDQINNELERIDDAIQRIIGVTPAFVRPPYGAYNDLVTGVANGRGQAIVMWDFEHVHLSPCHSAGLTDMIPSSEDAISGASLQHSQDLYANIAARRPDSILTLNHETNDWTAHQLLPFAIQKLQAAGYRLVTVAECLGVEPYQKYNAPITRDDSWHC
ncbi:chitin deacetylase [Coprinopsis cinerea AmutBmut pab1-1]|nr:chitin deacetylase [Coprinopsis cinerea AmutBmut pab1-1]